MPAPNEKARQILSQRTLQAKAKHWRSHAYHSDKLSVRLCGKLEWRHPRNNTTCNIGRIRPREYRGDSGGDADDTDDDGDNDGDNDSDYGDVKYVIIFLITYRVLNGVTTTRRRHDDHAATPRRRRHDTATTRQCCGDDTAMTRRRTGGWTSPCV